MKLNQVSTFSGKDHFLITAEYPKNSEFFLFSDRVLEDNNKSATVHSNVSEDFELMKFHYYLLPDNGPYNSSVKLVLPVSFFRVRRRCLRVLLWDPSLW